mmetsp:Transcript_15175/g.18772  ORF Transcript_15175/g.18772 Transcript_15175/m.18772 type:complete len:336 (+) Transcript_15175:98-1105(+)
MFARTSAVSMIRGFRHMSTTTLPKVAVVGAAGGIGQPLSLLLKNSPFVGDLSLYDLVGTPGVAADLGHINSEGDVKGFMGNDQINKALSGCKAVVVPAGVPRKPGMTRDDLFNTNASIVQSIAKACAESCPDAFFLIISNPVNSTVPIFAEVLKAAGVYNPKKLFGVTTLDVTRANTFCADALKRPVKELNVQVLGGHAGTTILPVLSGIPGQNFNDEQIAALTHRIQFGGDEVVKAKDGAGSATLSMAYAGAVFTERLLAAAAGAKDVVECTFVQSPVAEKDGCDFFSSPVRLGPNGVEEILPMPSLSAAEQANYDSMIGDLAKQIQKGKNFGK